MVKNVLVTNKGISIGRDSATLLNLLIGANSRNLLQEEINKIQYLKDKSEPIDIITDLSLYNEKKANRLWEFVLQETNYMAGTVPIYLSLNSKGEVEANKLLELICEQCEKGVSIITIHPTVNYTLLELCKKRMIPCTSRGGSIVARDLTVNKREKNIYLENLDEIAIKCKENGVILSIGSTFRSGTILDALDLTYLEEMKEQIRIADYLSDKGVGVVVETPGHIDPRNLLKLCDELKDVKHPIMPLGPMVTDIGLTEDDTVAVIGASIMGIHQSADILSIVTSREHRGGIPDIDEMVAAISKYQIARHIIDLYKIGDKQKDMKVSKDRANKKSCNILTKQYCERCGEVCPLRGW